MTRTEALERRKQLAAALRATHNVSAVADRFQVSSSLVRKAWREFGDSDTPKRSTMMKISTDEVVACLRVGTKTADVAKHFRVSERQIVSIQDRVSSGRR